MSEAAAAIHPSAPPGPPPAAERRAREIDLYAEGYSFEDPAGSEDAVTNLFGADGFTFKDILDIVNPLQHLPVVGTLYRAISGDELAPGPRMIGGALFGGIGGFVTALLNAVVENETGSDIGDKVLAFFQGSDQPPQNLAATETVPAAVASAPLAAAPVAAVAPQPPAPQAEPKTIPIFAGPPRALAKPPGNLAAAAYAPAGTENPTEALIRARAAVPTPRLSGVAGLPQSRVTAPASQMPKPTSIASGGAVTVAAAAASEGSLEPASKVAAAPAAPTAVPILMRDALDKYEALMKGRTSPSISGDY